MSVDVEIYKTRIVVPVKWMRSVSGEPDPECPDPDERGYGSPERGPVIGITEGRTVKVGLRRASLDDTAQLYLTSSDTSVLIINDPATGILPGTFDTDVRLTGVSGGGDFRRARAEVRFGSATGPVIGVLHVRVWHPLDVDITPHVVTIGQTGGGAAAVPPIANINDIMRRVRDIWTHYGVTFTLGAVQPKTISLATAGVVSDNPFPGELRTLLANNWPDGTPNWVPNTINVYFVNRIGTGGTLGYGFSRASFAGFGLPNPGIILADRTATSARADVMHWANDLAHEIGHFFQLWHPENVQPPNEREDTWSRRELMHNFNLMRRRNPWPANNAAGQPFRFRPRFDDAGYGVRRRGCFVSIKDLTQLNTDGETNTSRGAITSAAGPY